MSLEDELFRRLDAVPLAEVCHYFGMSEETASKRAPSQTLPIPCFKIGSEKSPWMVNVTDLAKHIEHQHRQAREAHRAINAA